jgi:hypothetical protein
MRIIKKTLLDEFAMAALPAVMNQAETPILGAGIAQIAYLMAEAMLKERELHLFETDLELAIRDADAHEKEQQHLAEMAQRGVDTSEWYSDTCETHGEMLGWLNGHPFCIPCDRASDPGVVSPTTT